MLAQALMTSSELEKGVSWPLLGASLVSACNVSWQIFLTLTYNDRISDATTTSAQKTMLAWPDQWNWGFGVKATAHQEPWQLVSSQFDPHFTLDKTWYIRSISMQHAFPTFHKKVGRLTKPLSSLDNNCSCSCMVYVGALWQNGKQQSQSVSIDNNI